MINSVQLRTEQSSQGFGGFEELGGRDGVVCANGNIGKGPLEAIKPGLRSHFEL